MDWTCEVEHKLKRKNQILFSLDNPLLESLAELIEHQNHRTMVLWAFELADETAQILSERYPGEQRFEAAVSISKEWAEGKVKMPVAKRAILDVHAVAKEIESPEDSALCHAIGQACGVVHAKGHALGFPVYELTALVRRYGVSDSKEHIEKRVRYYEDRVIYWSEHHESLTREWADFMLKD